MDPNVFTQFGISAAVFLAVAAIVNPSVNQIRGPFLLDGRMTLLLAYGLSFLLTILMSLINPIDWTLPIYVLVAKVVLSGWASAVYAGTMADKQKVTDEKLAVAKAMGDMKEEPGDPPARPSIVVTHK